MSPAAWLRGTNRMVSRSGRRPTNEKTALSGDRAVSVLKHRA